VHHFPDVKQDQNGAKTSNSGIKEPGLDSS